jgi:hypothetical protein
VLPDAYAPSLYRKRWIFGPLQDNGGPTQTHAVLGNDFTIDRIPQGTNGCGTTIATDQRGVSRPQGDACDVGAFELQQRVYDWTGFFSPVDNPEVDTNKAKAGSTIPVKFSLGGDQGLDIFESGYPNSVPMPCAATKSEPF